MLAKNLGLPTFPGVTPWPHTGKGTTSGRRTWTEPISHTHLGEKVPEKGLQEVAPLLPCHCGPHQLLLSQLPLLEAQPALLQSAPQALHHHLPLFLQVKQQHLWRSHRRATTCQSLVRPEGSCESCFFFFGGAGGGAGGTGKITPAKEILLLLGSVELSGLLAGAEVARKGTCAKLCFLSTPYWKRDGEAGRAEDGET